MTVSRRRFLGVSGSLLAASGLPSVAWTAASGEPDVIVIGAGLSGLEAALTLEEAGLRVLVLEGRPKHIGGRIYTLFGVPGNPEVGGNTIANAYGRMIAASDKYGVPTVNLFPRLIGRGGQEMYIDGQHVPLKDWAGHPRNPFQDGMKQLPPWAWGDAMFREHMPFSELDRWFHPEYAEHDISVHEFLRRHGASEAAIELGFNTNAAYAAPTSHEVSLLMQAFADYWVNVNRGGVMAFSRTGASLGEAAQQPAQPPAQAPGGAPAPFIGSYAGGNQRLTNAMAARLKGDLLQGRRVTAIEQDDTGVTVRCKDGSRYRARAVVSSMPYSTLRHVRIHPAPPPVQAKAIATLGYIPITQFHLVPKRPFWEDDGLSPTMWTNGITGMILAQRFGKDPAEVTSLTVWARGLNAEYVDRMGPQEAGRAILEEIGRMRPAAKGQLEVAATHSWGLDPFAAGDWSIFRPGQVSEFARTMAAPHGRLFFCGEHTALGSRGMEAAMESAERVSLEVLEAIA
jgi:monoamine oxidase